MFPRLTWHWCGLSTWITKMQEMKLWFWYHLVALPSAASGTATTVTASTLYMLDQISELLIWADQTLQFHILNLCSRLWSLGLFTILPRRSLIPIDICFWLLNHLRSYNTCCVICFRQVQSEFMETLCESCLHTLQSWFTLESAKALESCICSGFVRRYQDWEMK